jgi:type I restriction enzyme R subunit
MSAHPFTEDHLVERPAIRLFSELGWETVSAMEETFGPKGTLGRETPGEAVLLSRLRAALERLNPALPPEAITTAIDALTRDRSAMSLAAANREVYALLKEGVPLSVADGETGGQEPVRVRVIDWERPEANDFLLVSQFSVTGPLYTRRPDLVGFVNGLPLVVVEFKKPGVAARAAFDDNLTCYKADIPHLFWTNAFLVASNGTESRVGSLTADWDRFFEWKRVAREEEPRRVSLETLLRGTCEPARLLDLVESFVLFSERKAGLVKVLAQNHQYLGVNRAIGSMLAAREGGHGRGGVFWQTQGSGKSLAMVFFAQKVLRKVPGNWSFVVVTDRAELDDQIARTFKACGAVSPGEGDACHASSGAHLRELLRGNHRYVFTLIHKFRAEILRADAPSPGASRHPLPSRERGNQNPPWPPFEKGGERTCLAPQGEDAPLAPCGRELALSERSEPKGAWGEGAVTMPVLSDRRDIVVLADEAHRTQYDTLALNMRAALPGALFLAFTGTPLIAGEERTREVFGDYVSIYDFQQSVQDGATVPLYYENRTPALRLDNPDLSEEIYDLVEAVELDETQERKLERELGRRYHLITRDDRLEAIAADIVRHFLGRGFPGKAMVVSIDKATALRMHDKVCAHWAAERSHVEGELGRYGLGEEGRAELLRRLDLLRTTDMALVVSPSQNEIEQMRRLGLEILPHRRRMNEEELDERFKDPADPLRLVFLCAMWLTGFDAESCSTVYLDKPMRNHTLMQTIARANRVFPGKHSGVIVDYANVFASLERALAIYGAGTGGAMPVRDKAELVADLRKALEEAGAFCTAHGVSLAGIAAADGMERLRLLAFAVDTFLSPDPLRKEFFGHERIVRTLFQAVLPDPVALELRPAVQCIGIIGDAIRERIGEKPGDISEILSQVKRLLDESIHAEGIGAQEHAPGGAAGLLDLSGINFEKLRDRFTRAKRRNVELERLKAAIRSQLDRLVKANRTRADFLLKFESLIEAYNAGSRNIEQLFEELLALSRALSEEEQRHVREHLSEEELVVFDLLTRPGPALSPEEREEVKKVARALLERVKTALSLNWRQKAQARAQVRLAIEDMLDEGLPPAYTPELYNAKVGALFEHIYESYSEAVRVQV